MTTKKILVTGGAGFIGSHLVDALIEKGHDVRVLDSLHPQVHPHGKPTWVNPQAEFIEGDVRARYPITKALQDIEVVFHEAAMVGVGQSMYRQGWYVDNNCVGTAVLLDAIINGNCPVEKLVVAGSISGYGEGLYFCEDCGFVHPKVRPESQLKEKDWELHCPKCGKHVKSAPTLEDTPMDCTSVYGFTKKMQEDLVMLMGKTYGLKTTCLRYANVYGPRQSLSNPYTGAAAIFISRVKNNSLPVIYEDGLQERDFISVSDIVQANLLALEKSAADFETFNVGSGEHTTVLGLANMILSSFGKNANPEIPGKYRAGDVRHFYVDISKIKEKLGFEPKVKFVDGLQKLIEYCWLENAEDRFHEAELELKEKRLIK